MTQRWTWQEKRAVLGDAIGFYLVDVDGLVVAVVTGEVSGVNNPNSFWVCSDFYPKKDMDFAQVVGLERAKVLTEHRIEVVRTDPRRLGGGWAS